GWRSALDRADRPMVVLRRTHRFPALVAAHLLRFVRAAKMRVTVGAMNALLGGVAAALSLRNEPSARPAHPALAILALPLCICAAVFVRPAFESERALQPMLRSARTPRAFVIAAFIFAIAIPASALGATSGAMASPSLAWLTSSWAFALA